MRDVIGSEGGVEVTSQQTHYVTTTLPTGCILVRSVSMLPKLCNFTTL